MLPVFNTCWMYWMAYTCEIHCKYHVFVVFRCFRHYRKLESGGAWQMYLPCIIVYFGCICSLDDVLTSNTSKYIQYIGLVNSGCIMYGQDLDVLCLYWGCIRYIRCIKNCIWHVLCKYCRCIRIQNLLFIHGHCTDDCRHFDRISLEDVLESSSQQIQHKYTNTT